MSATITLRNGVTEVLNAKGFDTVDYVWEEGATAVLTLYDETGAEITGASALTMTQIPGTTGRNTIYRVEVPHTVTLPTGTEGTAVVVFTNTDGKVGKNKPTAVRYED